MRSSLFTNLGFDLLSVTGFIFGFSFINLSIIASLFFNGGSGSACFMLLSVSVFLTSSRSIGLKLVIFNHSVKEWLSDFSNSKGLPIFSCFSALIFFTSMAWIESSIFGVSESTLGVGFYSNKSGYRTPSVAFK